MRKILPVLPWIAAVAIVLVLLVLGRMPGAGNLIPSPWDKLAHIFVFGALAVCVRLGASDMPVTWVVLITAAIGLLDELHQATIPGRTAAMADFLADVGGALAGIAAYMALRSNFVKRRRAWAK